MTEVGDFLGMSQAPAGVAGRSLVAGAGCGRGVAPAHRRAHWLVVNHAREPAVAKALQLAVPACAGHPDFDPNVGVGARFRVHHYAAKGGNVLIRLSQVATGVWRARSSERPGLNRLRERDFGVRDGDAHQLVARILRPLQFRLCHQDRLPRMPRG